MLKLLRHGVIAILALLPLVSQAAPSVAATIGRSDTLKPGERPNAAACLRKAAIRSPCRVTRGVASDSFKTCGPAVEPNNTRPRSGERIKRAGWSSTRADSTARLPIGKCHVPGPGRVCR